MATSETHIANRALSLLGQASIVNLSEASAEARAAKLWYETSRDAVLRDYDWDFARKLTQLALLTDTVPEWTFVYQLPADCISPRRIQTIRRDMRPPLHRIEGRKLLTDEVNAVLIYTSRVTDTSAFDPLFDDVLAYKLAANMTMTLTEDTRRRQLGEQLYQDVLLRAKTADFNQENEPVEWVPDWLQAR